MTREASADTRSRKSGHGAADLTARWHTEAAAFGWTAAELAVAIDDAGQAVAGYPTPGLILADIVERLAADRSVWTLKIEHQCGPPLRPNVPVEGSSCGTPGGGPALFAQVPSDAQMTAAVASACGAAFVGGWGDGLTPRAVRRWQPERVQASADP